MSTGRTGRPTVRTGRSTGRSTGRLTESEQQALARDQRQARRERYREDAILSVYIYDEREVSEQQYWQLVQDEGFIIADIDDKDDPLIKGLLDYPISSEIWYQFYEEYINWIEHNINQDTLKHYGRDLTVRNIRRGFDEDFTESSYELLLTRIQQYEYVMNSLKDAVIGHFNMSNVSKDGLKHLCESIDRHIKRINDIETDNFYCHLITIVELMFESRIFNAFMTGTYDGTQLTQGKRHYTSIWLRKGPIWGVGEVSFAHGGLRNFMQNYFRKLIEYAKNHDNAYNLVNINPNRRFNGPLTGGKQEILNIDEDKENGLSKSEFYKIYKANLKFKQDIIQKIDKYLKSSIVNKTVNFNGIKIKTKFFKKMPTKSKS